MPSNIERCYQCGQCTSVCPMGEQEQAYKIRKFLQMEKRGLANEESMMLPFIFYCTTCYRCQDNCPQGVNIVDGVLEIRANAVHKGLMLEPHRKVAKMLYEHGHAVPVTSAVMKNRVLLGLYEVPPTVHGSDEQLDEIRTLLKLTGFDQLLEDKVPEIRISESLTYVQQPVPKRSIAEEKA